MDNRQGSPCRCVCKDEFDTIDIDRQKYIFMCDRRKPFLFFLLPLQQFLKERGHPLDYCKYCRLTNRLCECGRWTPFKSSGESFSITEETEIILPCTSPLKSSLPDYASIWEPISDTSSDWIGQKPTDSEKEVEPTDKIRESDWPPPR